MKTPLWQAIAVSSLALAAPLAAGAQTENRAPVTALVNAQSNAPVHINVVQMVPVVGGDGEREFGVVTVSFTNLSPKPAQDVFFTVRDDRGNVIGSYDDAGSFAQGVSIRQTFTTREAGSTPQLTVERVSFANGSAWTAGELNPMSRRQASADF